MNPFDYLMAPLFSPSELFVAQYANDIGDRDFAFKIWDKLATFGNREAQWNVGMSYRLGEGVEKDYKKAMGFLTKAAEKNHLGAITEIGYMHSQGHGVQKSDEKACYYYKIAAKAGWSRAQTNLGYMYSEGRGVRRSKKEAIILYEHATKAHPPCYTASQNLANHYMNGEGVPMNHKIAEMYFHLARTEVSPKFFEWILISRRINKGKRLYEKMKGLNDHELGVPDIVRKHLNNLKSRNWRDRLDAASELRIIPKEWAKKWATEPLINSLENEEDSHVKAHICMTLGKIGGHRTVESLIACLSDEDQFVRCNSIKALGEIGGIKAVNPLINSLRDSSETVKTAAAYALGRIGDDSAAEHLVSTLESDEYNTRHAAIHALKQIGPAATDLLTPFLDNPDKKIRKSAEEILRAIK